MSQQLDRTFIEMNRRGIVPGPEESEQEFLERADYYRTLRSQLNSELGKDIPFDKESEAADDSLKEAFGMTRELYDIEPDWVPVFFSDYQLRPWQGGCAWIFQISEESPPAALIQLRKSFQHSQSYLYMYDRKELIVHELSHVGRLAYEEPRFEEFFSYRSSKSAFRRWFGPIVKSSFESLVFVIVLLMTLIFDISIMTLGSPVIAPYVIWSKLAPLGLIAAAIVRLWWRHRQFNRCQEKLGKLIRNKNKANAVIYRLTDLEIIAFSRMKLAEVKKYMEDQKDRSLRWKVIYEAYF